LRQHPKDKSPMERTQEVLEGVQASNAGSEGDLNR